MMNKKTVKIVSIVLAAAMIFSFVAMIAAYFI